MAEDRVRGAAELLADAWRNAATIDALPRVLRPRDLKEAYAIRDEMARQIGEKTVGWKIGASSPGLQRAEGYDEPVPGRIFEANVYPSPAELPLGRIPNAKVECEFAFRLSADLPPRDQAYTAEDLAPLAVLCPAFEVSGCRFSPAEGEGPTGPSMLDLVADNGGAGGLVVGAEIPDWRRRSLQTMHVDLRIDGGPPVPNFEGDCRADPLEVLAWLANHLSRRGIGLFAGDLVSTGSATHAQPLHRGASAIARLSRSGRGSSDDRLTNP